MVGLGRGEFGPRLQLVEAVGADREDDHDCRVIATPQIGQQLQERRRLGVVRRQKFFGLIDGDDEDRRLAARDIARVFGHGKVAKDRRDRFRPREDGIADVGTVALDIARAQFGLEHCREAVLARQRGAPGTDDGQDIEMAAVAGEARQDAGAQEGGFTGPRCTQDRGEARRRRGAEAAQPVEREDDGAVAAKENAGVVLIEGQQPAIGGAAQIVRGRPEERVGIQSRFLEAGAKAGEAGARKRDRGLRLVARWRDRRRPARIGGTEIDQLPFGREFDRQVRERGRLNHHAEDLLVHLLGEQEFGEAPARFRPFGADQDEDELALLGGSLKRGLPAIPGDQPALGIEVEEHIAPALLGQPIMDGERLGIVRRGMRNENLAQDRP